MKKILMLLILVISLYSCDSKTMIIPKDDVLSAIEEAYFEGQKDAIVGDIRIKKTFDSCWIWTKSPWDSGDAPNFNPSLICK